MMKTQKWDTYSMVIKQFKKLMHCVKSVRIWSFSGPYFPEFGLNTEIGSIFPYPVQMRENTDQ